jgi:3-oxoadipate enol-lactonase
MGCHTAAAWALAHPDRVAALILIGPVFGGRLDRPGEDRWDARAEALVRGGPEAFAAEIASGFDDPEIAKTVERLALDRARLHGNPAAVAEALREVPRSAPFLSLDELRSIDVPTLVVGSHDEADPAHPLSTARDWADTIPDSRFVVEDEGDPPLSWQGGRLSRVIAEFLDSSLEPLRDRSEGADAEAVVRSKGREQ